MTNRLQLPALLSTNAMSRWWGIDRRSLGRLLDGLEPRETRGRVQLFDVGEVVRLLLLGQASTGERLDPRAEKAGLDKVRRQLAELQLSRERREVIPAEQVEKTWSDFVAACRARLLGLPDAVVHQLDGQPAGAKAALLRNLLNEALLELSMYDPAGKHRVLG